MREPFISVVVCTFNRSDLLYDALRSLAEQTTDNDRYEVIIIDNNSTDNTEIVSKDFTDSQDNFRYIKEVNQGLSCARNRGYEEARGSYVAYMDDDAKADKDWLVHANAVIESKAPHIFGGPHYPFFLNHKPEWFKDDFETNSLGKSRFLKEGEFLNGTNIFFEKSTLLELGGFDPHLGMSGNQIGYGEESALVLKARKAKKKLYYCHEMKVYHLVAEYKMNPFWYIVSDYEHGRNADRMFGLTSKESREELTCKLLFNVKAFFEELRKSVLDKEHPFVERQVKENIPPIAHRLGQTCERLHLSLNKKELNEEYGLIELLEEKERTIKKLETSLAYKIGLALTSPGLLINFLKKLLGKG